MRRGTAGLRRRKRCRFGDGVRSVAEADLGLEPGADVEILARSHLPLGGGGATPPAAYSLGLWSCGGAGLSGCCAARGLRLRERSRPGNGWGMCAEGRSVRTQSVAP